MDTNSSPTPKSPDSSEKEPSNARLVLNPEWERAEYRIEFAWEQSQWFKEWLRLAQSGKSFS